MEANRWCNNLLLTIAILAGVLLQSSCIKDYIADNYPDADDAVTRIQLTLDMPEAVIASRADMAAGTDRQLNSLWVGIFSVATGKMTYGHHLTAAEIGAIQKVEHAPSNTWYQLPEIEVRSGMSYIVAVGNPSGNSGYKFDPEHPDTPQTRSDLTALLPEYKYDPDVSSSFSWDDYCNIATRRGSIVGDISTPVNNLVMSGCYVDNESDDRDWPAACHTPVRIPPTVNNTTAPMNGRIHLRRLVSQVRFHFEAQTNPNKNGIQIIDLTPLNYTVYNVPFISWLNERPDDGDSPANAGDAVRINSSGIAYNAGPLPLKANYPTSQTITNQDIASSNTGGGSFDFDFWLLENKRRAVNPIADGDENYFLREREWKTDSESDYDDPKRRYDNTGVYTALCNEGQETYNNCATYVAVECSIVYTPAGIDHLHGSDPSVESRIATVTYYIHLGAVGGDNSDFNNLRNHKYTYNVRIVDIEQFIVEAKSDDMNENRPGFEGVVADTTSETIELDAHYSVFNIALTDVERRGPESLSGFPFRLEVFDLDGNRRIIDQNNWQELSEQDRDLYYGWVEFRATTDANTLAPYQPYGKTGSNAEFNTYGRTFRLGDMKDTETFPHRGTGSNGTYYYTVFINEYAYETDDDESGNIWVNYVNKPNRRAWLNVDYDVSPDRETIYIRSKYALSQKSIQTFYDVRYFDENTPDLTAIGIEHINECYGLAIRWAYNPSGTDLNNGQYNQWSRYLALNPKGNRMWDSYLYTTSPQYINAIRNNLQEVNIPARNNLYVRGVRELTGQTGHQFDPQADNGVANKQFIEAMDACLNRNRDNNGDGVIDITEIRWYLPSSSELIDIVVGRNAITTPLMDYNANPTLKNAEVGVEGHWNNTRFHYASSNGRQLWSEEGMSTSNYTEYWQSRDVTQPWQVRCARALGTDLNTIRQGDLSPAFEVNDQNNPTQIRPTYFNDLTLRDYTNQTVSPHTETSPLNRICTSGFEFRNEALRVNNAERTYSYDFNTLANTATHDTWINESNAYCQQTYGQGWRVPNLKEISLIRVALAGKANNVANYISCTFREYGINSTSGTGNNDRRTFTRADNTGYWFGIQGNNINCITSTGPVYSVRCVRDITDEEWTGAN